MLAQLPTQRRCAWLLVVAIQLVSIPFAYSVAILLGQCGVGGGTRGRMAMVAWQLGSLVMTEGIARRWPGAAEVVRAVWLLVAVLVVGLATCSFVWIFFLLRADFTPK